MFQVINALIFYMTTERERERDTRHKSEKVYVPQEILMHYVKDLNV